MSEADWAWVWLGLIVFLYFFGGPILFGLLLLLL